MLYLQVEHLSWRSPDYGSLFISTLCDVFNEMAVHGVDVCTMLTQVKYICVSPLFVNCLENHLLYTVRFYIPVQVKKFTVRKRSCGKVMFLHLSEILFAGGLCPGGVSRGDSLYGNERVVRILLECILVLFVDSF